MSLLLAPRSKWQTSYVLGACALFACAAKTATDPSNTSTSETATSTSTTSNVGLTGGGGGQSISTDTHTGTSTALVPCVTHDAGTCENLVDSGVLPLPASSNFTKFEIAANCIYQAGRTEVLATTQDAEQVTVLQDLALTGLTTWGGTFCPGSCPPYNYYYSLSFYRDDGQTLLVRVTPGRCGGVTLEGTNCVPRSDQYTILSEVAAILGVDAGGFVMPSSICDG